GRFSYGYWLRTPTEAGLAGTLISSAAGHYLVAEQALWKPANGGEDRGLAAFFQYGSATPDVSPLQRHFGGGFQWTGLMASRAADVLGLGLAVVHISPLATMDPSYQHETSVEAFYLVHCRSWLAVAPDVQYIGHPSGDPLRPKVVVATLRMTLSY
ncbi:MAG TPA: carbohydrate porin, partial [Candidatus Acidoferrales bacterium]|nr:carbohydrate porin [Candidatus Acidoferrales bacterium]